LRDKGNRVSKEVSYFQYIQSNLPGSYAACLDEHVAYLKDRNRRSFLFGLLFGIAAFKILGRLTQNHIPEPHHNRISDEKSAINPAGIIDQHQSPLSRWKTLLEVLETTRLLAFSNLNKLVFVPV